jgi:hypothetical protein
MLVQTCTLWRVDPSREETGKLPAKASGSFTAAARYKPSTSQLSLSQPQEGREHPLGNWRGYNNSPLGSETSDATQPR